MKTIVVPVYPSQLDAFKEKADILAEKIKQSLNIKVSKFKRYEYLARGIGHTKGHDRLIANAKLIAQADKDEPLMLFSDPVVCNQIGTVFKFHHNQDIAREVQEICKAMGSHEGIMASTPYLYQDEFQIEMTPALQTLLKSGQTEVIKPTNNKLPVILLDLTQVPSQIAALFYTIPEVIAFDFDIHRKDILYSNCKGKGHIAKGEKNWRVKASLDSWCCEEIPMDVLTKWNIFKTWLSQFVTTERIELTERISDRRWRHSVVQSLSKSDDIIGRLSNNQDKLLYTLLSTDFDLLEDIGVFSIPVTDIDFHAIKSKATIEQDAFYDKLAKEMDQQSLEVLQDKYSLIEKSGVTPGQWCQDIMFDHSIPQQRAADFLKDIHGIDVKLLPEPELYMNITDKEGNSTFFPKQDDTKLSNGEEFSGRKRGAEFNHVFSDVVDIFNACKNDFDTTLGAYPLRELANSIYLRMANTKGFTSLDLAGWLLDNSRKVCIPIIFNEE